MNRVPQLECKYGICLAPIKFSAKFFWRKPVVIQPIIVLYRLKNLEITSNQPVSSRRDCFLNVGQAWGSSSPCSSNPFFLIVLIYFNTGVTGNLL